MLDREISFMGRITAGMTHEIRNVYAIIRESAGLMEDILSVSQEGTFKHREKFLQVVGTIQEQVNRGVELSTQLNRFAHSMDEATEGVDLDQCVTHTAALLQRFARLKQVELKVQSPGAGIVCVTDPFRLQMILAECVDWCLGGLGKGDTLLVGMCQAPEGARVTLRPENSEPDWDGVPEVPAGIRELSDVTEPLGIVVEIWACKGKRGVSLTVPRVSPSAD